MEKERTTYLIRAIAAKESQLSEQASQVKNQLFQEQTAQGSLQRTLKELLSWCSRESQELQKVNVHGNWQSKSISDLYKSFKSVGCWHGQDRGCCRKGKGGQQRNNSVTKETIVYKKTEHSLEGFCGLNVCVLLCKTAQRSVHCHQPG